MGWLGILELLDPDDETRNFLQNITTYLPGDMENNPENFKQETYVQYCHSASKSAEIQTPTGTPVA